MSNSFIVMIMQVDRALAVLKSCAETGDGNLLELAMQVRMVCSI